MHDALPPRALGWRDDELRGRIKHQWFRLYSNFYRRPCVPTQVPPPRPFVNGFEHVFVGDYGNRDLNLMFKAEQSVDYFDGEE